MSSVAPGNLTILLIIKMAIKSWRKALNPQKECLLKMIRFQNLDRRPPHQATKVGHNNIAQAAKPCKTSYPFTRYMLVQKCITITKY